MPKPNLFNFVKVEKNQKNMFDLSHDVKLSMDMGNLVPTMAMPVIPGDKFDLSCEMLVRFAPMLAPVMHRFDVSAHYFFVPNRLLWDGWELFMRNGQDNGTGVPAHPYITVGSTTGNPYTALLDYMGIPPWDGVPGGNVDQTANVQINPLPFAAYQLIWEEYFRDQNLDPNTTFVPLVNGDNNSSYGYYTGLRKRCWEHDYFTSALPWTQRGPSVGIPINMEDVPIRSNATGEPGDVFGVAEDGAGTNFQTLGSDTPSVPSGAWDPSTPGNPIYAKTSLLQNI